MNGKTAIDFSRSFELPVKGLKMIKRRIKKLHENN